MKKNDIIIGFGMFVILFVFTFFVVKWGGGFEKANGYFIHTLSWKEMIPQIPSVAFLSLICVGFLLYAIRKMK
jgi:uncharacterized membrane protein